MEKHKEAFYKFLVERGCLFSFLDNVAKTKYKSFEKYCETIKDPYNWVMEFFWEGSIEGFDFWASVNSAWQIVCMGVDGIDYEKWKAGGATEEKTKKFIEFLCRENAYFPFMQALSKSPYKTIEEFCIGDPEDYFVQMWWHQTPEGYNYWSLINSKWRYICEK